jgi:FkbM family methyltransferase
MASLGKIGRSAFPELSRLFSQAGFTLVDIGGRGKPLRPLKKLGAFADYVSFEPDAGAASELREELVGTGIWRRVIVVPKALASGSGTATLNITRKAGYSSLLEPNMDASWLPSLDNLEVVRRVAVPVTTLDSASREYGFADACFLKLDTQGSELDILKSGEELLRDAVVGIYVECSFRELYREQALFSEVDEYLRAMGFALFSLARTNVRRAGFKPGSYSARIPAWAHCLYLREPGHLAASDARLPRLLGLALAFKQFDLALELVKCLRDRGVLVAESFQAAMSECEELVTRYTEKVASSLGATDRAVLEKAAIRDDRYGDL